MLESGKFILYFLLKSRTADVPRNTLESRQDCKSNNRKCGKNRKIYRQQFVRKVIQLVRTKWRRCDEKESGMRRPIQRDTVVEKRR